MQFLGAEGLGEEEGASDLCNGFGAMPRCYRIKYPATLNGLIFSVLFFMEV